MNNPLLISFLGCPIVYAAIKNLRWNDIDFDLWGGSRTLRVRGPRHRT